MFPHFLTKFFIWNQGKFKATKVLLPENKKGFLLKDTKKMVYGLEELGWRDKENWEGQKMLDEENIPNNQIPNGKI